MSLQLTKHEVISLKKHSGFSESWLQETIANDTSILGLGDLEVIERERVQERSGRLDLLLSDGDSTRYTVELMLGATDPSHIIRCIEYWDGERRRYPGYEHIAVLVAEDITTRFLNVMSLMAGNIPLIAIQLCALQVGEHLVLNFVPVLRQQALRRDDESESGGQEVDRAHWDARVGPNIMGICDGVLTMVNELTDSAYQLKYVKSHIGVSKPGDWRYPILFWPKKKYVHLRIGVSDPGKWVQHIEEIGLPVAKQRENRIRVTVSPDEFEKHRDVVRELLHDALGQVAES